MRTQTSAPRLTRTKQYPSSPASASIAGCEAAEVPPRSSHVLVLAVPSSTCKKQEK